MLKRHAPTADEALDEPGADEMSEVRERILAKLERLRERDGSDEQPVETKSAVDRVALIVWGLTRGRDRPSLAFGANPSPRSPLASRPLPQGERGKRT